MTKRATNKTEQQPEVCTSCGTTEGYYWDNGHPTTLCRDCFYKHLYKDFPWLDAQRDARRRFLAIFGLTRGDQS
jgi:ribosomal protein S14